MADVFCWGSLVESGSHASDQRGQTWGMSDRRASWTRRKDGGHGRRSSPWVVKNAGDKAKS